MNCSQVLNLEWNELEGNLTSSLGDLSHLEVLNLATNNLQGELPGSLGRLAKLRILELRENQLSSLPKSLSRYYYNAMQQCTFSIMPIDIFFFVHILKKNMIHDAF